MPREFTIVTFDCFGTLIDWETGIASAFAGAAARRGETAPRAARPLAEVPDLATLADWLNA